MLEITTKHALIFLAGVSIAFSTRADAQVGALFSLYSDYRFRGVSLSDGRPVGIVDVAYDLRSGLYGALSGRLVGTAHEGVKPLGVTLNAGYARSILPAITADVGVVYSKYSHYSGLESGRSYTEVYTGISGKLVGARLSLSPDYLGNARWTAYGEVDGHLDLSSATEIEGEIGALSGLGRQYRALGRPQFDARLGISHRLGPVTLHATVTAHGREYLYSRGSHHKLGLVIGASTAL